MKKVTAKEIAERLGVSQATVSMSLRGRPGISESVRSRVLEAAKEMGYSLPKSQSSMLQLVIYKKHGRVVSDSPFIELLIHGVYAKAEELGYHLSVSYFYGDKNRGEQLNSICSVESEGILLLATEMSDRDLEPFMKLRLPLVTLDNFSSSMERDAVVIDNLFGVRAAVQYLVKCGHTRIGYLRSNVDIRNFLERRTGYFSGCQLLSQQEAKDASRRIVRVGVTTETAAASMREYLSSSPILPTAFFADNDHIAAGCARALHEAGYRIPEDISIIGFDDAPICEEITPALTTMAVPKERMGGYAVSLLTERIRHPASEIVRVAMEPRLVIRESVLDLCPNRTN